MTMLKPSKAYAWRSSAARPARKALCLALSVFLLCQAGAAPLAAEYRPATSGAEGQPASATVAVREGAAKDPDAVAARTPIPGGMGPALDLDGRPLPANPNQMASADARSMAGGRAAGEAKRAAENWLRQFGTARLDLLGSFHGGALDMLFPLHDSGTGLIFSQFGARRSNLLQESYRTTLNLGLGYRHFGDGYMAGGNAFLDQDVSRGHRRLGLGAEWWADYLKFGMNGYFRLSDWKRSPDARDYRERPAHGWDIRAEGYLPQYPQLGGKLMFEKYYGDEVGLFGASNRQRNPSAWTLGVSYTPAPAVTLGLDHRMGQGGKSDTSFKLGLKYAIGVPLAKQMQPGEVAGSRKLAGMRMDLVERNNEIVLEYKKNDPMTIQLPASASGYPQTVISFPVTLAGADAAPRIEWSGSAAAYAMPYGGGAAGSMKLPDYRSNGANSYQLMATATDAHGRKIRSNVMNVSVNPLSVSVARSKTTAIADGVDSVRFTAQVRGVQAEAMAGRAVEWALKGAGTIREASNRTNADGTAYAVVSSKVAAVVGIEATESLGFKGASEAEFLDDPITLGVAQLDVAPASMLANGKDKAVLKATVKDSKGNAAGAGVAVSWTATGGLLAGQGSSTDADGVALMELLSATAPGSAAITARAGASDPGKTRSVDFLLDVSDAKVVQLTAGKTTALADGIDSVTLTATVADGRGNPVGAGVAVNWSASLGTLGAIASNTDANSQATVVLTAPAAVGSATITARGASGDAGKTAVIAFVADAASARVASLVPGEAGGVANGTDSVVFTATVEDGSGNRVGAGVAVSWTTTLGAIATTSATNASGEATALLTAPLIPGTALVTATAAKGDAGKTVSVGFVVDVRRVRVVALAPSKASGLADGADTVILTATVDDGRGNPVGAGVAVNWTTDLGTIAASSVTNAGSQATVVLTAPAAIGAATVTAKCAPATQATRGNGGDTGKTAVIAFTADVASARVVSLVPGGVSGVANGSDGVALTATIQDGSGNRVGAGVAVNWTSTLGTITTTSATNASGEATALLTAPLIPGTALVTATAAKGDAGKAVSVGFAVDVRRARVTELTPSKTSGLANGADTVTFTATVDDGRGNPVGAGVTVSWSASLGTLAASVSKTDAGSQATIVLTAPSLAGVAAVTAKAASGDGGHSASVTFAANVVGAHVVSLSPSKTYVIANGTDTVTYTATVQNIAGNPVGAGVSVRWSANAGTLAGAASVTDASSQATIVLTASTQAGIASVTAKSAADDSGMTMNVGFVADPSTARVVELSSVYGENIYLNAYAPVRATVHDANGNLMGAGVAVRWSTDFGAMQCAATVETDSQGVAWCELRPERDKAGVATVKAQAQAADPGKSLKINFVRDASRDAVFQVHQSKGDGVADGKDTVTLRADVRDWWGDPVGPGVTVNWTTTGGTLAASTSATGANSEATMVLTAPSKAGTVSVTAKAGESTVDRGKTATLTFSGGAASARVGNASASKTSILANGRDTVTITAVVLDGDGNAASEGQVVSWSTSLGILDAAISRTNAYGVATAVLTAGTVAGVASVTAKAGAGDAGGSTRVTLTADPLSARVTSLSSSKAKGVANGRDTLTLSATVHDINGNLEGAGITVNWRTNLGSLAAPSSTTDARGVAKIVLRAPASPGTAVLTARAVAADGGKTIRVGFDRSNAPPAQP